MEYTKAIMVHKLISFSWLTGPIFDKELRVSSRRKRNYVLRGLYLAVLTLVVLLVWLEEVHVGGGSAVYQSSRLFQAGLYITGAAMMVQFYAAQILSVIMLSNSISDEVYHKTLGALMSTPISSLQIVTGKLFSKLLQIVLLLGLTLPILGIVRVFGGVPWDYLLASFCVTLTAVLFAGMLSLNLSIHHKHAYVVIIVGAVLLFFLYVVLPLFAFWTGYFAFNISENTLLKWVSILNPLMLMMFLMQRLFSPGMLPFSSIDWWWHCVWMLGWTGLLYLRAVVVVRKKALLQACGQGNGVKKKVKIEGAVEGGKIRRVKGNPLLWKEMRRPMFEIGIGKRIIMWAAVLGCLLFSYAIFESEDALDDEIHCMYGILFLFIGVFFTAVFSATTITSEKNSRSWAVLLCTLMTDWQIVFAKGVGVIRRSLPVWGILIGHMLFFSFFVRYIHPIAILLIFLIIVPAILLLTSSGIMFSVLLKNTTSAVIANLIFAAMLWGGIPFLALLLGAMTGTGDDLAELAIALNPFYHMGMVLDAATGQDYVPGSPGGVSVALSKISELDFYWPGGDSGFSVTLVGLFMIGVGSLIVSYLMLVSVKNMLRKKIF